MDAAQRHAYRRKKRIVPTPNGAAREKVAAVKLVLDGLSHAAYWRLFCKASAHGRSVPEEIVTALNAESIEVPPDAEARLAAARAIRQLIAPRAEAS